MVTSLIIFGVKQAEDQNIKQIYLDLLDILV